jgi:hypothetical protein
LKTPPSEATNRYPLRAMGAVTTKANVALTETE